MVVMVVCFSSTGHKICKRMYRTAQGPVRKGSILTLIGHGAAAARHFVAEVKIFKLSPLLRLGI